MMASHSSAKATTTGPNKRKAGINQRLREDLSPDRSSRRNRSLSPTSSTSSFENGRKRRRTPESPRGTPKGPKRRHYDDSRSGSYTRSDYDHSRRNYGGNRSYEYSARKPNQNQNEGQRGLDPDYSHGHYGKKSQPASRSSLGQYDDRIPSGKDDHPPQRADSAVLEQKHSGFAGQPEMQGKQTSLQAKVTASNANFTEQPSKSELPTNDSSSQPSKGNLRNPFKSRSDDGFTRNGAISGSSTSTKTVEFFQSTKNCLNPVDAIPAELTAEERKKKREALKAKLKSQSTDLRVHAMQQNAPHPLQIDTPNVLSDSQRKLSFFLAETNTYFFAASSPKTPQTPADVEIGDSLVELHTANPNETVDQTVVAGTPGEADGPSAADYDPTVDMREDQLLQEQRLDDSRPPAEARRGLKQVDMVSSQHGPTARQRSIHIPVEKNLPMDDMFASDDEEEDDMFAPKEAKKPPSDEQLDRSPPRTKGIDASMLENWDDPEGYYRPILGEIFDGKYRIQNNLGKGMFSGVVRAIEESTNMMKAIKINRANDEMVKTAQKEMRILQKLGETDPDDRKHLVRFDRSFYHRGHLCLVFENLSLNLREVLKKHARVGGFHIKTIRTWAKQMFLALGLMRKCNVVHADLKPDNILANEALSSLKVCDLGSATEPGSCPHADLLVSRFYRAPEIILGYPYNFNSELWALDYSIDMWSVGCTLFELFTGKILFTGRDNNQMLRSMMETRGKFPIKMLKKSKDALVYFDDANQNFRSIERDKVTGRDVVKMVSFQQPTRQLKDRVLAAAPKDAKGTIKESDKKELALFTDLLDKCLALNPEKRIIPGEALRHPFIQQNSVPFVKR